MDEKPEWVKLGVTFSQWLKIVKEREEMERLGVEERDRYYEHKREKRDRW